MSNLPWSERVNALSVNPHMATADDVARLAAELNQYRIQLEAWQHAFGTTQLTHALARLEAAERRGVVMAGYAIARDMDREIMDHAQDSAPYLGMVTPSMTRKSLEAVIAGSILPLCFSGHGGYGYDTKSQVVVKSWWRDALAMLFAPFKALSGICKRLDCAADVTSGRVNHAASAWVETDGVREEEI